MKLVLAAVLIGGCLLYLAIGEEKTYGLAAGVLAAYLCRVLAIDPPPLDDAEPAGGSRDTTMRDRTD